MMAGQTGLLTVELKCLWAQLHRPQLRLRDDVGNTDEENSSLFFPNPNVAVAVSKGMWHWAAKTLLQQNTSVLNSGTPANSC